MRLVTPKQMNEIDKRSIERVGIPGVVLMENAAIGVVQEVLKLLGTTAGKKAVIFAGKGNNGGDAFAVARRLYNLGVEVSVYIAAHKGEISGDAAINLKIIENMGIEASEVLESGVLKRISKELFTANVIIDGLLGTGLKGGAEGLIGEIINLANGSGCKIVSIDIPSGVNGETGKVEGACIKADVTVTFGLPKTGSVVHPGCEYTGRLVIADIGIPEIVLEGMAIDSQYIDGHLASGLIPGRKKDSNKGDYGKIFFVCGSLGMTGAGILAGGAALRTGAGLVFLGVPALLTGVYDASFTEAITVSLEDGGTGCLTPGSLDEIRERLRRSDVAVVGPGLSADKNIQEIVNSIIEEAEIPLVLDADALNAVAKDKSVLRKLKNEAVITPHPGEMGRLLGITAVEVQNNRIEIARSFAKEWKVVTVLKGAATVVADPDGSFYINSTGNSGMSKGGSGDVLTGIIASLIGQGSRPIDAAVAGVYLHGLAGDNAAKIKGEHGMIAGDIVEEIPGAIKQLTIDD